MLNYAIVKDLDSQLNEAFVVLFDERIHCTFHNRVATAFLHYGTLTLCWSFSFLSVTFSSGIMASLLGLFVFSLLPSHAVNQI